MTSRDISAPRRRIAIIGGGLSGVAVAARLARLGRRAPEIVLIERGARFGPGLAYATDNDAHLLNVRASNMSARADAPGDFAGWLEREHNGAGATYAPRRLFGAYVEHVLRQTELATRLERVCDEALACRPHGDGWLVNLASGERVSADAVVLAIGHRQPATLAAFEQGGAPMAGAWDAAALEQLSSGDVLLVGTGLTMVDAVLSLAPHRRDAIYALSRRGLLPRCHRDGVAAAQPMELPLQLSEAVRAFRREVAAMAARGEPWQLAVDRLRADTPRLWRRLPIEAQRRFLRHLRPWWDVHRHRAAPEVAAKVAALQASGQLRVLAGQIVAAAPSARGLLVEYRPRGARARRTLEVAAAVNCTGGDLDFVRSAEPLLSQLLGEGLARPHANGLGLDVDAYGRLIGAGGTARASLFAIGAPTQGAFWECTAVPEIRTRAASLAALLSAPLAVT